jgi:hypothetical protein
VLCFYRKKRKTKEKEKCLHELGPTHTDADPTARIQLRLKKKLTRRGPLESEHFTSGTPIYFKNY